MSGTAAAAELGVLSRLPGLSEAHVWLLTMGRLDHAGAWGLSRSARAELSLPLVCVHARVSVVLASGRLLTEPEVVMNEHTFCAPRCA